MILQLTEFDVIVVTTKRLLSQALFDLLVQFLLESATIYMKMTINAPELQMAYMQYQ